MLHLFHQQSNINTILIDLVNLGAIYSYSLFVPGLICLLCDCLIGLLTIYIYTAGPQNVETLMISKNKMFSFSPRSPNMA